MAGLLWKMFAVVSLVAAFGVASRAVGDGAPTLRLPPDVTYREAEGSPGPVVFSHSTHVAFTDTKCIACHPSIFSILQPTRRITHAEMDAGTKCGACHDGSKASAVQGDCTHCHQLKDGS
jgi:c(7)-type cytochrome triheme protein